MCTDAHPASNLGRNSLLAVFFSCPKLGVFWLKIKSIFIVVLVCLFPETTETNMQKLCVSYFFTKLSSILPSPPSVIAHREFMTIVTLSGCRARVWRPTNLCMRGHNAWLCSPHIEGPLKGFTCVWNGPSKQTPKISMRTAATCLWCPPLFMYVFVFWHPRVSPLSLRWWLV